MKKLFLVASIMGTMALSGVASAGWVGTNLSNNASMWAFPGGSYDYLSSSNGQYTLLMQTDCNFVLYHGTAAIWASNTDGCGDGYRTDGWWPFSSSSHYERTFKIQATMQSDGNLVVYAYYYYLHDLNTQPADTSDQRVKVLWASNTNGRPYAMLTLQNDGNLVMTQNGSPFWATNTH